MAKYYTNADRILQAVLVDSQLSNYAGYNPYDIDTISAALVSENMIVRAIAKIIDGNDRGLTEREIYNEVSNYLKNEL